MIYIFHIICLIIASSLQGTLMKSLGVFGVSASLFVVYSVTVSFLSKKTEGVITAGISGLILDILTGRFIGVYTVLFIISAFTVGEIIEKLLKEQRFFVCMGLVFVFSFFIEFFYYLIVFSVLGSLNIKFALIKIVIESIYNGIISVPVYFIVKKSRKFIRPDKGEYIER